MLKIQANEKSVYIHIIVQVNVKSVYIRIMVNLSTSICVNISGAVWLLPPVCSLSHQLGQRLRQLPGEYNQDMITSPVSNCP